MSKKKSNDSQDFAFDDATTTDSFSVAGEDQFSTTEGDEFASASDAFAADDALSFDAAADDFNASADSFDAKADGLDADADSFDAKAESLDASAEASEDLAQDAATEEPADEPAVSMDAPEDAPTPMEEPASIAPSPGPDGRVAIQMAIEFVKTLEHCTIGDKADRLAEFKSNLGEVSEMIDRLLMACDAFANAENAFLDM